MHVAMTVYDNCGHDGYVTMIVLRSFEGRCRFATSETLSLCEPCICAHDREDDGVTVYAVASRQIRS